MVAYTSAGLPAVYVENKFWAGLTENQPNQYLDELENAHQSGTASMLMFVCPERATTMYGDELRRRLNARTKSVSVIVSERPLVFKVSDELALMVSSWRVLLDLIARTAEEENDRQLMEDTNQLRGLIDRVDDDQAFLPLRPEELGADVGQRWRGIERLQWELIQVLTQAPYSMGYVQNSNHVEIGGPGKFRAWIGVQRDLWARYGLTPIWLVFYSAIPNFSAVVRALGDWLIEVPTRAMLVRLDKNEHMCIPLIPPSGVAKEFVIQILSEQVRCVRDRLIASEVPN